MALHLGKNGHEGHLNIREHLPHPNFAHFIDKMGHETQRHVGIFAGIIADGGGRKVGHIFLPLTLRAYQRFDGDGFIFKIYLGKVVHVVIQLGLHKIVGQHGVEHRSRQTDATARQDVQVVFQILADLQNFVALIQGSENFNHRCPLLVASAHGHVPCLSAVNGKAHSDNFGGDGVSSCGLRVNCYFFLCQ